MDLRLPLLAIASLLLPAAHAQTPAPAPAKSMHHQDKSPDKSPDKPPAVPSTTLTLQTAAQTLTLTLADLQALPQTTVKVHNAHTNADETYTGPLLSVVLAKAGLSLTSKNEHDFLRMYVLAAGTDNYFVVYSGAEIQPALHHAEVLVALMQDAHPLSRNGAFQLIDALDVKPARWVRNLNKLTVVTDIPH